MAKSRGRADLLLFPDLAQPPQPKRPPSYAEIADARFASLPDSWQLIIRALINEVRLLTGRPTHDEEIQRHARINLCCEMLISLKCKMADQQKTDVASVLQTLIDKTHNRGARHILRSARLGIY